MIFACTGCGTACFCEADPADHDTWPSCRTCDHEMVPDEVQ